jgi:hypothetical protein
MNFDVFISYAHQDKAAADAACAKIEADGIRCWIAPRDVPPGAEWAGAIINAIDNCRVMVLIFSSSTNGSRQIDREAQRAFDKEKSVIPFRIEDVAPQKSLAYYLGPVHWLDALTPPLEKHLQKLSTSVKGFVQAETPRNDQTPQTLQKTETQQEAETKRQAEEQERQHLESEYCRLTWVLLPRRSGHGIQQAQNGGPAPASCREGSGCPPRNRESNP